jgi:thiamine pyrophosphate-dependent acetolactate synthase large subunit-like protein
VVDIPGDGSGLVCNLVGGAAPESHLGRYRRCADGGRIPGVGIRGGLRGLGALQVGLGFQESDPATAFASCSVYNAACARREQAPRVFEMAFQHAIARQGVAVVALSGDVAEEDTGLRALAPHNFKLEPARYSPSGADLDAVAEAIDSHGKVTLYCGAGVCNAHAEVIELAERLKAPVGYTLRAFNHGSMANALPQAIGAQLAYPGRQVVALCGNGGLTMLLGDLSTITTCNLPIKLIVFDNGLLDMVHWEMLAEGFEPFETDLHNPDFAKLAEAYGILGIGQRLGLTRSGRRRAACVGWRSTQPGASSLAGSSQELLAVRGRLPVG